MRVKYILFLLWSATTIPISLPFPPFFREVKRAVLAIACPPPRFTQVWATGNISCACRKPCSAVETAYCAGLGDTIHICHGVSFTGGALPTRFIRIRQRLPWVVGTGLLLPHLRIKYTDISIIREEVRVVTSGNSGLRVGEKLRGWGESIKL